MTGRMIRGWVFLAAALAWTTVAAAQFTTTLTVDGAAQGDNLGGSVACGGDVNNDGFDDVVVGSPLHDTNGSNAGRVQVYSGINGIVLYTFDGAAAGDNFGHAVAGAGDVNNDGFDDIVVGAPFHDTGGSNSGRVQVYSGATGAVLYTFGGDDTNDQLGTDVAGVGDVNNDGHADIIAGAPGDDNNGVRSGAARVYSGIDGSILYTLDGDNDNDNLGYTVGGGGDVDADGYADVIAGIWGDDNNGTNAGAARIYSGFDGSIIHHIDGDFTGDEFGRSVNHAGDVNRDGYDDIIVGAPRDDNAGSDSGSARVVSGFDASTLFTFNGTSAADRFGEDVNGAGDVNGDGYRDLIVGSPLEDNGLLNSGTVTVFSGKDGSIITQIDGSSPSLLLGYANAGAGDLNGDGFSDVIIGSRFADDNGTDAGRALTLTAPTLGVLSYETTGSASHRMVLEWLPDMGDPASTTGTLLMRGASPGGLGRLSISLARIDIVLFGYAPLLIAIDPVNAIFDDFFGFDGAGMLALPNLSRQNPFLAGTPIFIQSYEMSPVIRTSNGLRSLIVP